MHVSSAALILASSMDAQQIDQYRLLRNQQQQQQTQDASSAAGVSGYCAQNENADAPECAASASDMDPNQTENDLQADPDARMQTPYRLPKQNLRYPSDPSLSNLYQEDSSVRTERSRTAAPTYRVPERPTEFQRFVQSSTGRLLPIYGASLFDHVPSTFAPIDHVPVTPDYTVGPGDEVDVRVWGQINFTQRLVVDRSGDIFFPQVGRVSLAGLKYDQLQGAIRSSIARVYKNFDLNVNMGQLRSIQVFVVGQARRPGSYTVSSLSTLVNALFASGGPSSRGSMRDIQLKRGDRVITTFDFYDLLLRGDKSKDVPLQSGDVIFIPSVGPRVAITGSVESSAIYEIRQKDTLRCLLEFAGGVSPIAGGQQAILERVDQRSSLRSDNIQLTPQGLSTALQDGDIVRLFPVVPRFERTVALRGNVADPVRFPWHPGMKVSDLIPDKQALLTRTFWRERNRLTEDSQPPVSETDEKNAESRSAVLKTTSMTGSELNPVRNYREEARNTSADSSLAAAQSGDDTPPIRHFLRKNDIQPVAPDIDWNYAAIERLDPQTLSTRLIAFNLGKVVIDHDASADVALEPGDVVNVFSMADIAAPRSEQTRYVRLEGEVKMAGVYSVMPGETLRDVVARAGGLTPNAYLYGAQLTRESTKREQQKRYTEFLDQLDRDINQSASTLAGRVISAEQAATAQASIQSQHAMVDRLRQTPATGRIVLDLQPESNKVSDLPALPLENGDRLYVPSVPSTVNVVGTVYNQSAFVYAPDLRLGDYLHDAGGPTRYADSKRTFVIRADGSVVARETRSGLFSSSFDGLRIYPGDTIVVPTNITKTTRLRGFLDWSQVISNFGIGAAAINVLR
jgi:protein involved in polysaccharide export with SLBB domain